MNGNILISIEGNIGSGKSTLLNELKNRYGSNNPLFVFVDEPVDEWEKIQDENGKSIIENFYSNTKKFSFPFQILAYITRLTALKHAIETHTNKFIVCERSLYTDQLVFAKMLFDAKDMELIPYKIYMEWVATFSIIKAERVVYVNASPSVCHARVLERNRRGENIQLEYLQSCGKYHDEMIEQISCGCKILHLDGNMNINEMKKTKSWDNRIMDVVLFITFPSRPPSLFSESWGCIGVLVNYLYKRIYEYYHVKK